jgi:hypothetical protein
MLAADVGAAGGNERHGSLRRSGRAHCATTLFLLDIGLHPEPLDHEEFKAAALNAAFGFGNGEDTFYANVLCRAGVAFGSPTT